MPGMKDLYQKVTLSEILQKKLIWIADEAENAGEKKTNERLIYFAKDAGYDITIQEMQAFFKELSEEKTAELSDDELDMVAGGKSRNGINGISTSILTLGIACVAVSMLLDSKGTSCGSAFQ